MIQQQKTTIKCDVCLREVAVKNRFKLRNFTGYITLQKNSLNAFGENIKFPVHICNTCWDRLSMDVLIEIRREEDGN